VEQSEIGSGRTLVRVTWQRWGADLHVHIGGGDEHIGAAALVGQADDGKPYAETLRIPPHQEDRLALAAAWRLHAAIGTNVCVTAGIHLDAITPAEIGDVTRNIEAGVERLAGELQKSSERPHRD
jgi:hypothetical protein